MNLKSDGIPVKKNRHDLNSTPNKKCFIQQLPYATC